jgi:hypothetical protein
VGEDLGGGEFGPSGEVASIDGSIPSGDGWGEKGGVIKGNLVCDGS